MRERLNALHCCRLPLLNTSWGKLKRANFSAMKRKLAFLQVYVPRISFL